MPTTWVVICIFLFYEHLQNKKKSKRPCSKSSDKCGKAPRREWGCARWSNATLASRSSCTRRSPGESGQDVYHDHQNTIGSSHANSDIALGWEPVENTHRPKHLWQIEAVSISKIAISRLSTPRPCDFYVPLFFHPNGIISHIRHKRGIVFLLNKSLPRHWQLSGTFVLWYHLQTPAQAFHICVKTTSL